MREEVIVARHREHEEVFRFLHIGASYTLRWCNYEGLRRCILKGVQTAVGPGNQCRIS